MNGCNKKDYETFFKKVLQTQSKQFQMYEMACDQNPGTATEQFQIKAG